MTANLNWLLETAVKCGCMTAKDAAEARSVKNIVLKRYLRTVVSHAKDTPFLDAIDQYVVMMSQIRAAGSNLFAIRTYDKGTVDLDKTLLNQTFVKWCLLPFKGALSKPKTSKTNKQERPPHPELDEVWTHPTTT